MYEQLYALIDDCFASDFNEAGHWRSPEMDGSAVFLLTQAFRDEPLSSRLLGDYEPGRFTFKLSITDTGALEELAKRLLLVANRPILEIEEDPGAGYIRGDWGGPQGYFATAQEEAEWNERRHREWEEEDRRRLAEFGGLAPWVDFAPYRFIEALVRLRPAIESRQVVVIPKYALSFGDAAPEKVDNFYQGPTGHLGGDLVALLRNRPSLRHAAALRVRVPQLDAMSLKMFLRFREENDFAFESLQRAIKLSSADIALAGERDESRLLIEAIDRVDYEARRLEEELRSKKRKSRALARYDMTFLTVGLALYGILPDPLRHFVMAAIGGVTLKDVVDRLREPKVNTSDPFYVAWSLQERANE